MADRRRAPCGTDRAAAKDVCLALPKARRSRRLPLPAAGLLAATILAFGGGPALASLPPATPGGCASVSAFNGTFTTIKTPQIVSGFSIGDVVTFTFTYNAGTPQWQLNNGNGNKLASDAGSVGQVHTVSYTVTGNDLDTTLRSWPAPGSAGSITIAATCTTDSSKLDSEQTSLSKQIADTSGQAISGSIEDGIAAGFDGGGPATLGPNGLTLNFAAEPRHNRIDEAFSALGYADKQANPMQSLTFDQRWNVWASVRGTGWNGHGAAAGVDGLQINLTGGIGYKVTSDLLVGAVVGYEHFNYDVTSLSGTLKGDGGSVGGYLGWRFGTGLRFDAAAVWSGIGYDATAGSATGSFNGSRWLVSSGLTGSHKWGGFIFEPSGHLYALWESQGAWTDSLTTAHPANSFSNGRGSLGTKIAYPWMAGRRHAGKSLCRRLWRLPLQQQQHGGRLAGGERRGRLVGAGHRRRQLRPPNRRHAQSRRRARRLRQQLPDLVGPRPRRGAVLGGARPGHRAG